MLETHLSVEGLADRITRAWEAELLKDAPPPGRVHPYVYASAFRDCTRRMVYEMTVPERLPVPDATLRAKFRRGKDRERDLLADLVRIGRNTEPPFEVVGQQQDVKVRGRSGEVVISGRIDALLQFEGTRYLTPIEVKSWSPNIVDRIRTFADVFESPWTRAGAFQLLAYLYGHSQDYGFLLLDRSGLPLLLPVQLTEENLAHMEHFLAKAEEAVAHHLAGTLPDYIRDHVMCKRCPFYGSPCQPPSLMEGAQVLIDEALEQQLEEWHSLRPAGKQWSALDRDIKDRLRGTESALIGHFTVTGTWSKQSRLEVPADIKRQFTITDPKGRFTLEIERL